MPLPAPRLRWMLGSLGAALGATALALSCLPDLESVPVEAGAPSTAICGDGVIDPDAGEECDPGVLDAAVPGCSRACKILCAADGLPTYLDRSSDHCYYLLSPDAGPNESVEGCERDRAHVITFNSAPEVKAVQDGLEGNLYEIGLGGSSFWLGVHEDGADSGVFSTVIDEPGFAPVTPTKVCPGCFVEPSSGIVAAPKRATGDLTCARWETSHTFWTVTDCDASYATVCEREPVGSRVSACNGLQCFDTQYDLNANIKKTYLWVPDAEMTAQDAANYCAKLDLDAGGVPSLVIFDTYEQREQIFYELMHLPLPPDGGPPSSFWLGLTATPRGDGGAFTWTWDNGNQSEIVWGDHEPRAASAGLRAYASQTSRSYERPASTYDTQLAHSREPPDGGVELHGVLCQIQSSR